MNTLAVIYARVSSKEQEREGYSIDAQLRLLSEYADREGFQVQREFVEIETAKQAGRPVFREMLEFLQADPECRTILAEKTDRLYRNIRDWVTIDDLELDIHFVKEAVIVGPNARSSDKFIHGIKVLVAKNYVDNLSEEIQKGMTEKVLKGGWPHRAPFGYRNVDGLLSVEPDPEKAKAVKWLYHRYAAGDISLRELRREFRRAGYPFSIANSTISKVLGDPFYKGVMRWRGELHAGAYDPLVDSKTWNKVQVLLKSTSKVPDKVYTGDFTYKGLLTCGHCDCAIVGEKKKGKYIYYHCTQNRGECKANGWIRQETIDAAFAESLKSLRLEPEMHDQFTRALREVHITEMRQRNNELTILNDSAKQLRARLDTAYQDKLTGRVDEGFWRKHHAKLQDELNNVFDAIKGYHHAHLDQYEIGAQLLEFSQGADRMFQMGDIDIKRQIVNLVHSNCQLRSGTLMNTMKKPFYYLIEGRNGLLVEHTGLEPVTSCVQGRRSPN